MTLLAYADKVAALSRQVKAVGGGVRLDKPTSNLFRSRANTKERRLDVRALNQVIEVRPAEQRVFTEGMTRYVDLADTCLAEGVMPLVVPQLKSITIGGAISGIGIESSSFRHGLPHESVLAADVLLADGDVVRATPDNEYSDLFLGLPNSYGTLGYILGVEARTMTVKPYVELTHRRFHDTAPYFAAVAEACAGDADFIDGTIFAPGEMFLSEGRFVDAAPYSSDYGWMNIYFRSIREREQDFLSLRDYLWRWDTDWFWCSKNVFAQNPLMRLLLGRNRLNSITYQKIMRWNNRVGLTASLNRLLNRRPEAVIQDVDIPLERAAEFLHFFQAEIGIQPVWICPIGGHDPARQFPLYPLGGTGLFVNFGFWDTVPNPARRKPGYFNRRVEDKVRELGGVKSLYSESCYDEATFWETYNGEQYFALKAKYDPEGRFKNLYQKCVLKS